MTRSLLLAPFLFLPFGPVRGQPTPPPAAPTVPAGYQQVKLNGHTFTLPVGFTIEVAAGADVVPRPVAAAFDEKGGLYVTDSSGSNEKVQDQLAKKPHRVLRLEDKDGDGRYETSTVFVPNVMLPEGAMWLAGSLYVAAPPHILKFTDTDGDGRADKEEVWFDGKTLTGCANDLHGPYLGPDGWVYWCKGAFAKQEHTLADGRKLVTRASHIFRCRPDGSGLDVVMTGGMDNPVDVVFTATGDRIFSCTFLQHPRDGKRDGLIHAVPGAVYGKPHDVLNDHPWTGPELMPPMTHLGPAAPCGLHRYESDQFGPDYADNLFCCQFNLRKVSRHVLVPTGSTYTTRDSDFLVSDSHDFHPTDVIEDADGSLLVIDTGGWYKLCCPTSQLVKPDVTGAIYRIKKVGAHRVEDPRGAKIDWAKVGTEELVRRLGDLRPVVQARAIDALAGRGDQALKALGDVVEGESRGTFRARLAAIWTLARFRNPLATEILVGRPTTKPARAEGLSKEERSTLARACLHAIGCNSLEHVRRNGLRVIRAGIHPEIDPPAVDDIHIYRVAAEVLGRAGAREFAFDLLSRIGNSAPGYDRTLDHALTYALIQTGDPAKLAPFLDPQLEGPRARRAVLVALDQMPDGKLDPAAVLRELAATDAALRDTAWWIAGRHPDWGDRLAGYFRDRLKSIETLTPPEQDELVGRGVPFLKGEPVRKAFGEALARTAISTGQRPLLRGMARAGLKAFPAEWEEGVRLALFSRDADVVRDAAAVLRAAPPGDEVAQRLLGEVERYRERNRIPTPPEVELVIRAATPFGARLTEARAADAIDLLHRDKPGPVRAAAADLLTRQPLPAVALARLAAALPTVPPAEVGKLLPAFDRSADEAAGLALVSALSDPAVRGVVRAEQVKPTLDKYPPRVRAAAEKLYALLAEARRDELARLDGLVKELPDGDVRRGQAVFNGKGQCATCHKIGYVGGLVGPDLTRIGGIRSDRDLLESIVFPSASFVRSYEPVRVTTADGRVLNGLLASDAADGLVIVTGADKTERVARADVESVALGSVSVMPAGLDQQLTRGELADLVAFLRACR